MNINDCEFEKPTRSFEGLTIEQMSDRSFYIKSYNPQITLKGIEYLAENSTMQKAVNIIKEAGQMAVSIL